MQLCFLDDHCDRALVLISLQIEYPLAWVTDGIRGDMVAWININFKAGHMFPSLGEYTRPHPAHKWASLKSKCIWGRCSKSGGGYNFSTSQKELQMYDKKKLDELKDSLKKWEETSLQKALSSLPERADEFITTSSEPINRLYTPLDVADKDYDSSLGLPGEYPFTR